MRFARNRHAFVDRLIVVAVVFTLATAVAQQVSWWPDRPDFVDDSFDGVIIDPAGPDGEESDVFTSIEDYQAAPRCLAHELSVPGQGSYFSGSSGGLVLGEVRVRQPGSSTEVPVTPAPAYPGDLLGQSSSAGATPTFDQLLNVPPAQDGAVVIIVADDFAGYNFEIPPAVASLAAGDEAALEALFASGELSHGALVLNHLNRLIEATGRYDLQQNGSAYVWRHRENPSAEIVVWGLDLASEVPSDPLATSPEPRGLTEISSHSIARTLTQVLDSVVSGALTQQPVIGVVVNMSWVLLPCATVAEFIAAAGDYQTFEDYVLGLEIPSLDRGSFASEGEYFANVMRLLSWVGPSDPLFLALSGGDDGPHLALASGTRLAAVGAAGNFGMAYQMLPAAWPRIVGAGSPAPGPRQAEPAFSNAADVVAPGAWFLLQSQLSYAGTSYSAPLVSLFTAIEMAGGSRCTPPPPPPASNADLPPGLTPGKLSTASAPASPWLGDASSGCPY